ncbi:MAG: TRAP transporter small permease [Neoaquamicrobium sediminum]|uniref:TRAP transporter small permease n=1 Tax=Neoaquamicrobium sediminum TaxID=1849104 RepID=UPI004037203D
MPSQAPADKNNGLNNPAPREPRGAGPFWFVETLIGYLVTGAMIMSSLCIFVILVIGVIDTTGRAFFNSPFIGAVEISEALLAVAIFSALGYLQKTGGHVVVDVFSNGYGPRLKKFATLVILAATLAVLGFLLWRSGVGALNAYRTNDVSAGFLRVPIWLAKIFTTVGLGVAVAEAARELARATLGFAPQGRGPTKDESDPAQNSTMEKL